MPFGLYLHIPYCLAKCHYCDFYSRGGCKGVPEQYVDALVAQMHKFRENGTLPSHPDTLYFGGGTPSLLTPAQVKCLIDAAAPAQNAEVTLEANPETVTPALLEQFLYAGVNRLSLGVQTASDQSLQTLGRPHTVVQSRAAFADAKRAGFTNISGDIMMALPNYSTEEFDQTLDLIAGGGATHISAYLLKIEENTVFGKRPPQNLPTEDQAADFYLYGVEQLSKAGFAQYEISNFSRPGFEGKHNLIYWNCQDYLGLGPAAHSCVKQQRFYWPNGTKQFIDRQSVPIPDGVCDGNDYIMLQLRLTSGLNLQKLKQLYQIEFTAKQKRFIANCQAAGYLLQNGDILSLTPAGMIIQNTILCELLSE